MDDLIFSTSLFRVLLFSPAILMPIFFALGVYGIWRELNLKRSQLTVQKARRKKSQLNTQNTQNAKNILTSVFQLIFSLVLAISLFMTYSNGEQKVTVRLDNKSISYGKRATYYIYSGTAYRFNVSSDAYNQMQVGSCYEFIFYPSRGVLSIISSREFITRIAQVTC